MFSPRNIIIRLGSTVISAKICNIFSEGLENPSWFNEIKEDNSLQGGEEIRKHEKS